MLSSRELHDKYKPTTKEDVYEIVKKNIKDLIEIMMQEKIKKLSWMR
ncbi:hypothetical protein ACWXVO_00120 [Mycoplasma sp. 1890]